MAISLSLALVLLVAGYFGARPAWRYVKAVRAQRFLREAEENLRQEKWAPGFEQLRSALQLAPLDPRVLRAAAYAYGRVGSESGFAYFDALLATPSATTQDREEYVALALAVGNQELARAQLEDLLESANPSSRALLLGSQWYAGRRDVPTALKLAREAVRVDPANPTNQFTVATLLISSQTPADVEEAREILWRSARTPGPFQVRAIEAILASTDVPRSEREEILKILSAKSSRTALEELALADATVSLDPSRRAKLADDLIERFGRGDPAQVAQLSRWLNHHELFARTRDLLLPDVARKDPALFRLRYAALVGLNDLRGAYEFLTADKPPGNPMEIEFLRCSTALRLKDQAAVDSHYRALIKLGQQNARSLRAVAEFAFRNGNRAVANEVYLALARSPRDQIPALRGLLRNADYAGEVWNARDYARKLATALGRKDEALTFQIAYYDLLLKENLDEAAAAALALHQAKPEDFNRRALLALAHLRQNEPAKAMRLLEAQVVNWNSTVPGVRAIIAACLGANGQREAAADAVDRLSIATLKTEERDLIKPYVRSLAPSPAAGPSRPAPPKR